MQTFGFQLGLQDGPKSPFGGFQTSRKAALGGSGPPRRARNSPRPQNVQKMYKRKASGWASKEASKGEDAHVTQPNKTSFENEVSKGKFYQAHVALEKSSA